MYQTVFAQCVTSTVLNGGYTFEKYSVALPYKEGDVMLTGLAAKEARALRALSHGSGKPDCAH